MDIDGKLYCPRCMRVIEREGPCPHCGHGPDEPRPPMALEPGTLLNRRYQLGSVIGQGGFGITYAAWDETLGMPVAIKEYFPSSEAARNPDESDDLVPLPGHEAVYLDGLNRFRRESNLLASLQGIPCVVKVLDFFSENETAYLVMEFVHGVPVDQWVREAKIRPRDLIAKLRPVLDALVRTHSQGVIHRDITPDNLLVTEDGSFRLIDFGSAVEVERSSGTIVLTRKYAPVEQYGREYGALGPWTDVYGLAAVIYELVSGQEPMESPLRAHHDGMKPLTRMKTGLKRGEAAAVTDALTVAPEKRTQSMAEFRARLYNLPLPEEVRKRKRFIRRMSIVAVILLLLAALAVANFTTGLPIGDGLLGSFTFDGIWIVREVTQKESRELPEAVIGVPVSGIRADAFRGNKTLRQVTIPGTVHQVGDNAFYGCENLEHVAMAEGVESIGLSAFGACHHLREMNIPDTVAEIGDGCLPAGAEKMTVWGHRGSAAEAYADANRLRFSVDTEMDWEIRDGAVAITAVETSASRFSFPDCIEGLPVTEIDVGVFLDEVRELWLPESLELIPWMLCEGNRNLVSVHLGPSVKTISAEAFDGCSHLAQINWPSSIEVIGGSAFRGCHSLPSVSLPEGTKVLEKYAFAYCSSLTEVILPESLTEIGSCCFQGCEKIVSVHLPEHLTELSDSAFHSTGIHTLHLPESLTKIGRNCFTYTPLEMLLIPESVESVDEFCFYGCTDLRYVQFMNDHVAFDGNATTFWLCSNDLVIGGRPGSSAQRLSETLNLQFEEIDLWTPGFTLSGNTATFSGAETGEVRVPWYNAEEDCPILHTKDCGKSETAQLQLPFFESEIGESEFAGCASLREFYCTGPLKRIGDHAFEGCENLWYATLPDGLLSIGEYAFSNSAVGLVFLPDSLTEMGSFAFSECTNLAILTIGSGLKVLPWGAFSGSSLTSVIIPGTIVQIGSHCFSDCEALSEVFIEPGVRRLDGETFENCRELSTVVLPASVYHIGGATFRNNIALTDLWVYNPDMLFNNYLWMTTILDCSPTIHGYPGSTAEVYANAYGLPFAQIDPE